MRKFKGVGTALSIALVGIVLFSVLFSGCRRRRAIPASMGKSGSKSKGSETDSDNVTHHPILVLPKVSAETNGADSFSPAAARGEYDSPAGPVGRSGSPDSLFPRTSFLPDPEHLNSAPTFNDVEEPISWPDGRPIQVPGDDSGIGPSAETPTSADHRPPTRWRRPRR